MNVYGIICLAVGILLYIGGEIVFFQENYKDINNWALKRKIAFEYQVYSYKFSMFDRKVRNWKIPGVVLIIVGIVLIMSL